MTLKESLGDTREKEIEVREDNELLYSGRVSDLPENLLERQTEKIERSSLSGRVAAYVY